MEVIKFPHPTLRRVSRPIKRVDAELRGMVARMIELMYESKGIGLAANQVDLPYRIFVMNPSGDPEERSEEFVMINPVLKNPKGMAEAEEGCLSIPNVYADVKRPDRITINAYDLAGNEIEREVSGLFARIVQHETDHLDGQLFIDRLPPTALANIRGDLEELEAEFHKLRSQGKIPSDEQIAARIKELEKGADVKASTRIPLGELAHARSGDKGNHANIGVAAYTPAGFAFLQKELTPERVAAFFAALGASRVERFELPRVQAFNFLLYDALAGGASRSLRIDTQGKLLGTAILELPLDAPADWKERFR